MNNSLTKIVTLIPSATEIVAFLGQKNSIVGRSHECDYPNDLNNIIKLTSPKINVDGTSSEINKQINTILENSLSVYKVNIEKLKELDNICEECIKKDESVSQNLIMHGYKICDSCKLSKTIIPV